MVSPTTTVEVAVVRYEQGGKVYEECLWWLQMVTRMPSLGGQPPVFTWATIAARGFRAPAGKLEAELSTLVTIAAAHGARRLGQMVDNLERILGVELLCAAQGVEFRKPLATSEALVRVVDRLRQDVETLSEDRYLAPDLEKASALVASGDLARVSEIEMPDVAA